MHAPSRLGAVDSRMANPDVGMEAAAPVPIVSMVACIEDLATAVIGPPLGTSPDLGREKNSIPKMVASLHECMALLPATGLVPIGLLPALEKQAHSEMVASLHECMASLPGIGPVPVGPLLALEKQAQSCLEKENASSSMASPTLE
jgi:hypothetical protein